MNSNEIDIFAHVLTLNKEHTFCDNSVCPPEHLFMFISNFKTRIANGSLDKRLLYLGLDPVQSFTTFDFGKIT